MTKRGGAGSRNGEKDGAEAGLSEEMDEQDSQCIHRDNGQIRDGRQMIPRGTVKHT